MVYPDQPPDIIFARDSINDLIERLKAKQKAVTETEAKDKIERAITKLKACRNDMEIEFGPLWFMIFLQQKQDA